MRDRGSLLRILRAGTTAQATVLTVSGDLDGFTGPVLHRHVRALLRADQCNLILDLSPLSFIDCAGLTALVVTRRRLRAHQGSLHLVVAGENILRVFRLAGLHDAFSIHSDLPRALAAADEPDGCSPDELPAQTRTANYLPS